MHSLIELGYYPDPPIFFYFIGFFLLLYQIVRIVHTYIRLTFKIKFLFQTETTPPPGKPEDEEPKIPDPVEDLTKSNGNGSSASTVCPFHLYQANMAGF